MTFKLPDVGRAVRVVSLAVHSESAEELESAELASFRIINYEKPELVLAKLPLSQELEIDGPGSRVIIQWTDMRGLYEVEAVFSEIRGHDWCFYVTNATQITQRREYVRVEVSGDIMIYPVFPFPRIALRGKMRDLSEGSIKVSVDMQAAQPHKWLVPDGGVEVEIDVDGNRQVVPGSILRISALSVRQEVVIILNPPNQQSTLLRRYVLQQQAKQRLQQRQLQEQW